MDKMILVEIVAFFAGLLTTISFAPQVIQIWNERNPKAISLKMFTIMFFGVTLWFVVGFLLESYVMMFWNGVTMHLAFAIIVMKIRFSRLDEQEQGEWTNRRQLP